MSVTQVAVNPDEPLAPSLMPVLSVSLSVWAPPVRVWEIPNSFDGLYITFLVTFIGHWWTGLAVGVEAKWKLALRASAY